MLKRLAPPVETFNSSLCIRVHDFMLIATILMHCLSHAEEMSRIAYLIAQQCNKALSAVSVFVHI
jgi:hypothetical protein